MRKITLLVLGCVPAFVFIDFVCRYGLVMSSLCGRNSEPGTQS